MSGEPENQSPSPRRTSLCVWALLLLIVLFVAFARVRLRDMPLERDEGEYAYAGQLLLRGIPPYKLAYSMKLPGTLACYALSMAVFGQTPAGIHLGFTVFNVAAIVLMFFLGRRLMGPAAGLVASATYALMSLSPSVLGFAAHATQFVMLFALGGMLFLVCQPPGVGRPIRCFLSGLLFGLATLMKQPGLFFLLFGLYFLLWQELSARPARWTAALRNAAPFLAGGLLPLLVTMALLWHAGVFARFWFWTVICVRAYGTTVSWSKGVWYLKCYFQFLARYNTLLWLMAFPGLVCLFFDRKAGAAKPFILGLLVFSVIAASQGLYFRAHYFVLLLPAVGLLIAEILKCARHWILRCGLSRIAVLAPAGVFIAVTALLIWNQRDYFFLLPPDTVVDWTYPDQYFVEASGVARYVSDHTADTDRIVVFGSEPEIYFYSRRLSGTGYIYTYEMMQQNPFARKMQEDMVSEIKAAEPAMAVVVQTRASWANDRNSDLWIFKEAGDYWSHFYDVVAAVDLPAGKPPAFLAGSAAAAYQPGTNDCMYVLKRKPSPPKT